ncbi:Plug domain-containing protein [Seonamhaeicola sp. MEBiC1930]|uniref:hypothetical protein n=1 Tax=Seonamhaeicola sp. MEBiC01930 TaxID=2976768 RepID=UPI00324C35CA
MKKGVFVSLVIVVFLLKNNPLLAQIEGLPITPTKISYSEKIYLQLSSTVFTSDQIVWFKAIVTDVNHMPTNLSEVLHVELIDFDERIVDQKLIKLEKGIANSFFDLGGRFPAGGYMIRAYTQWNKNFDIDLITREYIDVYSSERLLVTDQAIRDVVISENSERELELSAKVYPRVINPKYRGKLTLHLDFETRQDSIEIKKDKHGLYSFKSKLPKDVVKTKMDLQLDSIKLKNNNLGFLSTYSKTVVVDKAYLDLQFFPEGGKLIDGLQSTLGFKALDYKNKGIEVSGIIVDQDDKKITEIKSNTLGMGICYLHSDINKQYFAKIKRANGLTYKYKLPVVHPKGYVLTTKTFKDYFRIAIRSNFSKTDSLNVKVQSRGIIYHDIKLQFKEGIINIVVKRNSLPEGIITITVFDNQNKLMCERLVFNYVEDRINIKATPHIDYYSQRDKTIINIQTKSKDSTVLQTNTSVLVLNKEQLGEMHNNRHHIVSHFLLKSELRGAIESPNYYFDDKNLYRYFDMDALMLTQGWRNYIYKPEEESVEFTSEPERGLMISGSIKEYSNQKKKWKKPLELTLMTFGKEEKQVFLSKADNIGHFKFNLADNYEDNLEYLIQTKNHRGHNRDYTINVDKVITPKVNYEEENKVQLADSFNLYIEENIKRIDKEKAFELAEGTEILDEVELTGYKLTPEREKMMELHGPPDIVIEDKELHSKIEKWSYGLFSVLMFNYPEDIVVSRVGPNGGYLRASVMNGGFTIFLIDGIPVTMRHYDLLDDLPTEEIKSVEILRNPKNKRKYLMDVLPESPDFWGKIRQISFISIYTYSKGGLFSIKRTHGIFKNSIPSFAPKREFYAPKYESESINDWSIPDLRSVIHWEPSLKTDENGNAELEFFNDDNIGDVLVIVESVSKDGKLGYYETTYSVDEKLEK